MFAPSTISPALDAERRVVRFEEAARTTLAQSGVQHVVNVRGAAGAVLTAELAKRGAPVLYVVADAETAQRAFNNLCALAQGRLAPFGLQRRPLYLPASEATPFSEARSDRRAAMQRAAALAQLAGARRGAPCVLTAPSLLRRVVPAALMRSVSRRLRVGDTVDPRELAELLSMAGYLRCPIVEDPASFSVRGGLFDFWSPHQAGPVRIELDADRIARLRRFNPEDQRTEQDLDEALALPAREAVLTTESTRRARSRMQSLCDAVDFPTSKARALVDDVSEGRLFFGADRFLPAIADLVPLFSYLGVEGTDGTDGTERADGSSASSEPCVVIEDPARVLAALRDEQARALADFEARGTMPSFPIDALYVEENVLAQQLERWHVVATHPGAIAGAPARGLEALEAPPADAPSLATSDHSELSLAIKHARSSRGRHEALDPVVEAIQSWQEAGLEVTLSAHTDAQAERLATLLSHRDLSIVREGAAPGTEATNGASDERKRAQGRGSAVRVIASELSRGMVASTEGFVWLTEQEIFGERTRRPRSKPKASRAFLEDLRSLTPGAYVVHVEHGIGRYLGLERRTISGVNLELLVIEYQAGDKLFVPVYRLNQVQRYSGTEGAPRLDRLGGVSFAKTKAKIQRRIRQLADQLLKLYAERVTVTKTPLPPPNDDYRAFEASFPFEETADQANAILDVLEDVQRERVMDRLVCGDVGFGKTEVALRAAFLNAINGRQVALLCPTTVLAQQHFLTFSERLSDYALEVRALSRFQSKKDQQDTVRGLKQGTVDVVIGTHRVLSKDVHFKNLGLLIVDEEQRFGVSHKERIKQLRSNVDVLTLSATPIPRTLQMAVGGLRDLSIITTPPVDRRAIRTLTSQFDEHLIRQALERELSRGGQVFYVYNRIEGLYERAERLQRLMPELRISVAHGQLSEASLERTMMAFIAGESDVLVTTAIIESGLDIPRANTIIIDRADMFGLSQLYQLRGRVGRSSERAYCYLLVPPPSQLSEEARQRVEALERYSELGAGLKVASLDMELRGTGDLLGAEQSGFAASVGFDLFCRMLEDAAQELRGQPVVHEVDPDLTIDVEALLPESYVADVGVRLSFYKRLASASDEAEVEDLASELGDRFGPLPQEAQRLVQLMRLKTELRGLQVLGCEATARSATLHLREDTPLDPAKVGALVAERRTTYRLTPEGRLIRRAKDSESFDDGLQLVDRMLSELSSCLRSN